MLLRTLLLLLPSASSASSTSSTSVRIESEGFGCEEIGGGEAVVGISSAATAAAVAVERAAGAGVLELGRTPAVWNMLMASFSALRNSRLVERSRANSEARRSIRDCIVRIRASRMRREV